MELACLIGGFVNSPDLKEGVQLTGVAMANLRPQPGLQVRLNRD